MLSRCRGTTPSTSKTRTGNSQVQKNNLRTCRTRQKPQVLLSNVWEVHRDWLALLLLLLAQDLGCQRCYASLRVGPRAQATAPSVFGFPHAGREENTISRAEASLSLCPGLAKLS